MEIELEHRATAATGMVYFARRSALEGVKM